MIDFIQSGERECPSDALFNSYVQHANRQGARRKSIETSIAKARNPPN
jgi:hypothetical protein